MRPITPAVRRHYDLLSVFYAALWGEHIHHGYWERNESAARAQVKLVERLARFARIRRKARVLDVGCGLGASALWLARNLDCEVVGVTISPVQASMATARAARARLADRVNFQVMDANRLELPRQSFDAVWVIECSEHLSDKRQFVRDCNAILRRDGVLAICAWLRDGRSLKKRLLMESICRGMLCPSLGSMDDYVAWMTEAGFNDIRADDITSRVARTWVHCARLLRPRRFSGVLRLGGRSVADFLEACGNMSRAYSEGAMAYGMFAGSKR